jgi:hypothetical protein
MRKAALVITTALLTIPSIAGATPCVSSSDAIRHQFPGAWPSYTRQLDGHKGKLCWFPAVSRHDKRYDPKYEKGRIEVATTKTDTLSKVDAAISDFLKSRTESEPAKVENEVEPVKKEKLPKIKRRNKNNSDEIKIEYAKAEVGIQEKKPSLPQPPQIIVPEKPLTPVEAAEMAEVLNSVVAKSDLQSYMDYIARVYPDYAPRTVTWIKLF